MQVIRHISLFSLVPLILGLETILKTEQCDSTCTLDDQSSSKCWSSNLNYFESALIGQIRNYVLAQATRFHFDKTLVLADELKSSISRLNEVAKEPVEDENNAVSYDTVAEAVRGMFEDIKLVSNETVAAEKYQVTCPVGCQTDADVFFVLSMVSIGFTVLLALTYLTITFIRDYKDAEASKLLDPRATLLKKPKKSKKKESSNSVGAL